MDDVRIATTVLSTSLVMFISGFMLGIYSIRGYLISPALADERRHNLHDAVESDESDVDEDDTILDHAPNWANGEEADRRQGLRAVEPVVEDKKKEKSSKSKTGLKTPVNDPKEQEECKLVLVVRTDLGMTKGKIAAQCGHATLACYKSLLKAAQKDPQGAAARLLRRWETHGQAKIALQTKGGEDDLLELMGTAHSVGITAEVIADAGRTQIAGGSLTVLGVGPAPRSEVDKITGHLKLL
ncbi:peptidyl-tRNA hydrolase PTH2-domain-containing protein [Podospora appendiculata]|uniref:peptidyl-tRNA hydrolase n=1 Tax=Podospora appendiculata TaxID=314037 RepID=A0AAE0X437_9PEZI|nr:peptidyl-tRNA hydrolase PTH2-domain-containing protein [Podospora appendiculata]KAK3684275.1 peptidyl-tRNA hydrolase PTH2-domain-containing protein [Podospora appendiculata]